MSAPFLLIDAGNSRIKWALVDTQGATLHGGAFDHVSGDIPTHTPTYRPGATREAAWLGLPVPGAAWISNVAGDAVAMRLAALLDTHWPGLPRTTIRATAQECGVTNGYAQPERLGSDRWAGMIGAHAAFPGEHLLIATLGTATTLEALRADGRFAGGLIAPGWSLMMRALGEHTAQLPTLGAESARALVGDGARQHWFATDTSHAISAGSLLAQAGLIERAWRELVQDWAAPVRLVLSGGAADAVARTLTVPHTRHDGLVLSGLARIAASCTVGAGCGA